MGGVGERGGGEGEGLTEDRLFSFDLGCQGRNWHALLGWGQTGSWHGEDVEYPPLLEEADDRDDARVDEPVHHGLGRSAEGVGQLLSGSGGFDAGHFAFGAALGR